MLYYSVAHYYDVNDKRKVAKYEHILHHINAFLKINDSKEFIIVSAIDTIKGNNRYSIVKNDLYVYCKKHLPNHKVHVIIEYNWGGTIAALWHSYLYLKSNNIEDTSYIAHFEEDFGPKDSSWYLASTKLLTDDIIYVGESNKNRIKKADPKTGQNDDGRAFSRPEMPRLALPEVWTDGGYYFTNINNLKKIESSIGVFHKGNQSTKYDNGLDGISIGEVGFPTLLHHAGFKFTCVNRRTYFINEWCGGR